jgi:hypothetical protein
MESKKQAPLLLSIEWIIIHLGNFICRHLAIQKKTVIKKELNKVKSTQSEI